MLGVEVMEGGLDFVISPHFYCERYAKLLIQEKGEKKKTFSVARTHVVGDSYSRQFAVCANSFQTTLGQSIDLPLHG